MLTLSPLAPAVVAAHHEAAGEGVDEGGQGLPQTTHRTEHQQVVIVGWDTVHGDCFEGGKGCRLAQSEDKDGSMGANQIAPLIHAIQPSRSFHFWLK